MRLIAYLGLTFIATLAASLFYWHFYTPRELTFSDGAHYAVIGRQLAQTNTYTDRFSFYGSGVLYKLRDGDIFHTTILPLTPLSIAASFKLFGLSDFSAVLPTLLFGALTASLLFYLSFRNYGTTAAVLSTLTFVFFKPLLDYSTSAATEPLFTLLLLAAFACLTSPNRLIKAASLPLIILTFYSRPHAIFYAPAFVLVFFVSLKSRSRKIFLAASAVLILVSLPFWLKVSQKVPYLNSLGQSQILFSSSPLMPANTALRSGPQAFAFSIWANLRVLIVKIIYNLYNLAKLLPDIYPAYLIPFTALALLLKKQAKSAVLFFTVALIFNLLAIAASVPSYRYLHPLLPFALLLGFAAFVQVCQKANLSNLKTLILGLLLFVSIPIISLIIDARYIANTHHLGQPSAVKLLGTKLGELTPEGSVVVTNLDVWGTWYGARTTIWFPLSPDQIQADIKDLAGNPVDYIYLTSYRSADENLFVGDGWSSLLEDPPTITNSFLAANYRITQVIDIQASDNYDNLPLRAVLLQRIPL